MSFSLLPLFLSPSLTHLPLSNALIRIIKVIFNQLYSKESEGEKGSLKQIQTTINRTNIPTKVKDDPVAVEDFKDLVLDAHIVAAVIDFFGMTIGTSRPTANIDISKIKKMPKHDKW